MLGLRKVYAKRNQFEPRVQELLTREEDKRMQNPLWVTRNLLTVNAPSSFREMCEARKSEGIHRRLVLTFF